jgi:GNAT superfamily N-acetyltransferase
MKSIDFITEGTKLEKHEMGHGMSSYQNDDILLAGGMRSGNSDYQHTRLKFMVYDLRGISSPEEFTEQQDEREMGYVELFVLDGTGDIDGLVNINLKPKARGNGVGRIVIESLVATVPNLKIFDIKSSAIPFWKKMGATFYKSRHFKDVVEKPTNVALKKLAKHGLYAIV